MTAKNRVLIIGAHLSDGFMRCGGTAAKYALKGDKVKFLCMSMGERGESGNIWKNNKKVTAAEVVEVRFQEGQKMAKLLGVDFENLNFGDHPLDVDQEKMEQLVKAIREFKPNIVLAHWLYDYLNPDHATAGHLTYQALRFAVVPGYLPDLEAIPFPEVFMFTPNLPVSHAKFEPDIYINISDVIEKKQEALRMIKTQPFLESIFRIRTQFRNTEYQALCHQRQGETTDVEAFKRFTPWYGEELPLSGQ